MENFNLFDYIYVEFTLAVLFLTEILKTFLPKPKSAFWANPKWLTLFVGIGLGIIEAKYKLGTPDGLNLSKLFISLGVTTLFYDYFWKLVKDVWTLTLNRIKKANDEVLAEDKKILDGELPTDQQTPTEESKNNNL